MKYEDHGFIRDNILYRFRLSHHTFELLDIKVLHAAKPTREPPRLKIMQFFTDIGAVVALDLCTTDDKFPPVPIQMKLSRPNAMTLLILLCGAMAGLGFYTFTYAQGFSYFSHDPKACANCHVMNEFYDSWNKSSHHAAGVCVDCHMPEGKIAKIIAKSDNGYRHSKGFTFMDFHEPISIKPRNVEILQENCIRCHGQLTHDIAGDLGQANELKCIHCHSHVGHR